MPLEVFIPEVMPSPGTSTKPMVRLKKAEFGDGYTQAAPDGLNHIREVLTLSWAGLSKNQALALDNFFRRHGGYYPFFYAGVFYEIPLKWTCDDWSMSASAPWKFTAKLTQYFGASGGSVPVGAGAGSGSGSGSGTGGGTNTPPYVPPVYVPVSGPEGIWRLDEGDATGAGSSLSYDDNIDNGDDQ